MAKSYKTELNELIVRYGEANAEKKVLEAQCKDLSSDIKEIMGDHELSAFEAFGYTATISERTNKKLNAAKIEKLLGKPIPADCWDITSTPVLNVKANGNDNKASK